MGNKIWVGERIEKVIENELNLTRKAEIRFFLDDMNIKFKEQIYDKGANFISKDFKIDYNFRDERCEVSTPTKNIHKIFPANDLTEMFEYIKNNNE